MSNKVVVISRECLPVCCENVLKEINCLFYSKAAFMDQIMRCRVNGKDIMSLLMKDNHWLEKEMDKMPPSEGPLHRSYSNEELEQIYDEVIEKRLNKSKKDMNIITSLSLEPIKYNNKIVHIDTMGYLVYGILKNERCRTEFGRYVKGKEVELYKVYRESEYYKSAVLNVFLQGRKQIAALLIGFICKIREETENSQYYNELMQIVYTGYRKYKNQLKKFNMITGSDISQVLKGDDNFLANCAETLIFLLIANDLKIDIIPDFEFYKGIYGMKMKESYFLNSEKTEISEQGIVFKKKIIKEGIDIASYYNNFYGIHLKEDSNFFKNGTEALYKPVSEVEGLFEAYAEENHRKTIEKIFEANGINLRAFDEFSLQKEEYMQLCEIIKKSDIEEYKNYLLTSTLCKYIHELELMCESLSEEERQYQVSIAKQNVEKMSREHKDLESQRNQLQEKQQKAEETLLDLKQQNEKLKKLLAKQEEQQKQEKEELIALRNYIYQEEVKYVEETEVSLKEKNQILKDAKVIIVGGHSNWQGKIKTFFKNAVCITADNPNVSQDLVKNADYIICNTSVLKHSCYYRIMSLKRADSHILYVGSNNVELCMKELRTQV